jgi:hypothetical protein
MAILPRCLKRAAGKRRGRRLYAVELTILRDRRHVRDSEPGEVRRRESSDLRDAGSVDGSALGDAGACAGVDCSEDRAVDASPIVATTAASTAEGWLVDAPLPDLASAGEAPSASSAKAAHTAFIVFITSSQLAWAHDGAPAALRPSRRLDAE